MKKGQTGMIVFVVICLIIVGLLIFFAIRVITNSSDGLKGATGKAVNLPEAKTDTNSNAKFKNTSLKQAASAKIKARIKTIVKNDTNSFNDSEIDKTALENIILTSSGVITLDSCVINEPFSCTGWTVDSDAIIIEIFNNDSYDIHIKSISIPHCREYPFNSQILAYDKRIFSLSCSNIDKDNFQTSWSVGYKIDNEEIFK